MIILKIYQQYFFKQRKETFPAIQIIMQKSSKSGSATTIGNELSNLAV